MANRPVKAIIWNMFSQQDSQWKSRSIDCNTGYIVRSLLLNRELRALRNTSRIQTDLNKLFQDLVFVETKCSSSHILRELLFLRQASDSRKLSRLGDICCH